MTKSLGSLVMAILGSACAASMVTAQTPLAQFSKEAAGTFTPAGWQRWLAPGTVKLTRYKIVDVGGEHALRAISDGSASGLWRAADIDLQPKPILRWRWRALELPAGADLKAPAKEDAAARICFFFDGEPDRPAVEPSLPAVDSSVHFAHVLCYAWAAGASVGDIVSNPSSPELRIMVLEGRILHHWRTEERDIAADFAKAFGAQPARIVAIGLITDSDQVGGSASAYYGDIEARPHEK
ncbi:MAG: DUF3047 domain-containing protein [Acidobacteriota bacterium]